MIKLVKNAFFHEKEVRESLSTFIKTAPYFSFGDECEKFEKSFAKYQGRRDCIMFNSGSSANFALILALKEKGLLKEGDGVGFSAVTWSTNVMPLIMLGFRPIPIDIELTTLNISTEKIQDTLKKYSIKALFITHLLGFCSDIASIKKYCAENNILLLEDACESLGTKYQGINLGNFGLASTFSFYIAHHLSTIEGGAVCIDDPDLAMQLRLIRAHGWDRNLPKNEQRELRSLNGINDYDAPFTFYDLGCNLRPTEINGFLGNIQLNYLDDSLKIRESTFKKIAAELYMHSELYNPISYSHLDFVPSFTFPLICKTPDIRKALLEKSNNIIETRLIVGGNIVMQPFWKKYFPKIDPTDLPNATVVHHNGFYFSNSPDLTDEDTATIISTFQSL